MTTSPYAPTFKQELRKTLFDFVYSKVSTHLSTQVLSIGERNREITGGEHLEFAYRGETFLAIPRREYVKPNDLHVSLRPEMDQVLKTQEEIQIEEGYITSYISKVLSSSDNIPDYLAMFPEVLHPPIQKLIDNCPCKNHELPREKMVEIVKYNSKGIDLVKKRLLQNMLM